MFKTFSDLVFKVHNKWNNNNPETIEFYEPLTDKTLKHKRNLLIFSIMIIAMYSLEIKMDSFFGFKFKNVNDAHDLGGLIVWMVVYEFFIFILSFISDLKAWDYKRGIFNSKKIIDSHLSFLHHMGSISLYLKNTSDDFNHLMPSETNQQDYDVIKMSLHKLKMDTMRISDRCDESIEGYTYQEALSTFLVHLKNLDTTKKRLRWKKIITYFFDFLIPIILSSIAIKIALIDGFYVFNKIFIVLFSTTPV